MSVYPNSGILFRNNRKTQPKHPDYQGTATIDGVAYKLAAWIKEGRKGKFMSVAFKPEEAPAGNPSASTARQPETMQSAEPEAPNQPEEDIPF